VVQRLTISLDDDIAAAIDAFMERRGYTNRSEAIRDLVRGALVEAADVGPDAAHCVAAVSYVYDHHERDLTQRLAHAQHAHHDLTIATMHAHLDHDHCMEVTLLRGPTAEVRQLAESAVAERGVRFGQINLVPVRGSGHAHRHGPHGHDHDHGTPVM